MEVAIKALVVRAAVAVAGFVTFLADVRAKRDQDQQTKTRSAAAILGQPAEPAGPCQQPAGPARAAAGRTMRTA
jgi:hypothetical protein